MANRQSRAVPLADVQGQGVATSNLPPLSSESGAAAFTQSEVAFGHLSTFLNRWADKAAESEASTAGTSAALQQGDNLQLRKDGTLAGKAFDNAAITTYANQMQTSLRNDMYDVAQANQGDPDALAKSFEQLRGQYTNKALIGGVPEMHAAFNRIFDQTAFSYQKAAARERDTALRKDALDSTTAAIQAAERDLQRSAFTVGGDGDGDKNLADQAGRIKAMYAKAAEDGFITRTALAAKVNTLDSNVASAKITGQFAQLEGPDQKQAFIQQLDTEYKSNKGPLKAMDVDTFTALRANLQKGLNSDIALSNQATREVKVAAQSVRDRLLSGYGVSDDEWGDLDKFAARSGSADVQQQVKAAKANAAEIGTWWQMPPADLAKSIADYKVKIGAAASPEALQKLKDMQTVYGRMSKEIDSDLIGFSERTGRIAPTALSPQIITSPDAQAAFLKRKAAAEQAAASAGVKPQYFSATEREDWAKVLNAGGDAALAAAKALEVHFGAQAAAAAIREVAPKAGLMAQAADVLAGGGSEAYARDVATSLALRGLDKYKPVDVKPADLKSAVTDVYGTAFGHLPATIQDGAVAGARAAFDTRVRTQGLPTDIASGKGKGAITQALQEAAGANFVDGVQYGGVGDVSRGWFSGSYKVPVPADVRADKFKDVIGAITDDDLKAMKTPPAAESGKPYTAADIKAGKLVAINGGYRVAMGTDLVNNPRYLRGADGQPFVLDLAGLHDTLKARVPGAFR